MSSATAAGAPGLITSVAPGLVAALALAAVHVFAHLLRFLDGIPRNRLLSGFGGISVAYVVVHLLPEVAEGQRIVDERLADGWLATLERRLYLLMLVGLVVFHGLELAARGGGERGRSHTRLDVFAVSVTFFGIYNALVGYLLAERSEHGGGVELATFAIALGVHLVVNDFALRQHHEHRYHDVGRWLLAGAVLLGWVVYQFAEVSVEGRVAMLAFVGGGVVLNVFKEELPEDRRSRLIPFVAGAACYSALLLVI